MVNKVFLVGRLGKDPVIKHFQDGGAIAEFSIATSENYKDKEGNWKEITDWHNIKLPNKFMAERAEKYLKKGSLIHVEGKIRTRSWDDKDGKKHYITEIIVDQFRMLDKKSDSGSSENTSGYQQQASSGSSSSVSEESPAATTNAVDDDLPF
jgi:single-strand DNA-binding protein